jgi:hypothetical protein
MLRRSSAAFAVIFGVGFAAPGRAQLGSPPSGARIDVEGGASFPSGGDLKDVYKVGYHVALTADRTVAALPRVSVRGDVGFDIFGPETLKPQYGFDRQWGHTFYVASELLFSVPVQHKRFYALAGGGYYNVRSAFLDITGVVLPAHTQRAPGIDEGLGMHLPGDWRVEIRHNDVFRRTEGIARWIPLTLGHTL